MNLVNYVCCMRMSMCAPVCGGQRWIGVWSLSAFSFEPGTHRLDNPRVVMSFSGPLVSVCLAPSTVLGLQVCIPRPRILYRY